MGPQHVLDMHAVMLKMDPEVEYHDYVQGIVPPIMQLLEGFRKASVVQFQSASSELAKQSYWKLLDDLDASSKHQSSLDGCPNSNRIVPMRKQSVLSAPQHHPTGPTPNQCCDPQAKLPIFWSTWWRWGPDDGFFNSMDRFYGPIGWWA